jgi:hypothetical protein
MDLEVRHPMTGAQHMLDDPPSHVSGNVAEGCFWYVLPPERNDPDTIGNQHFRLVIAARCAPAPELVDGQPAVRITFVGESILIHQIRKMTGTALGHLPLLNSRLAVQARAHPRAHAAGQLPAAVRRELPALQAGYESWGRPTPPLYPAQGGHLVLTAWHDGDQGRRLCKGGTSMWWRPSAAS